MTKARKSTGFYLASIVLVAVWMVADSHPSTAQSWAEDALGKDPRNASYNISARYQDSANAKVLMLSLDSVNVDEAAPVDLWRGVFQIAMVAAEEEQQFDKVILARNGEPVFFLKGDEFLGIGQERNRGQNPVYQLRTLPEKLYTPDGKRAFGTWTGGLIGVTGKQMEDLKRASLDWLQGQEP